jgi:hypothetical protein
MHAGTALGRRLVRPAFGAPVYYQCGQAHDSRNVWAVRTARSGGVGHRHHPTECIGQRRYFLPFLPLLPFLSFLSFLAFLAFLAMVVTSFLRWLPLPVGRVRFGDERGTQQHRHPSR